MSALFYQNAINQENQTIRVNDCIIRGHASVADYLTAESLSLTKGLTVGTTITHDNIPAANITQLTSINTAIDASTVANPYNFNVSTFNATTVAGATDRFFLNMPAGVLNNIGFASISVYYYSNVIGTAGEPTLHIMTQEADRVTILLRNNDAANALNGNLHFRFKYELGRAA
jgi:hypothetical protein